MKLQNLLPEQHVKSIFLGKDEHLDETLETEFIDHQILRMIQTHSDHFLFFDKDISNYVNLTDNQQEIIYFDDLDGIFTDQKNKVLVIKVADCYPILFYHQTGIIGAVHAGRVGTESQIIQKVLNHFKEERQLDKGWVIWLGPRICNDCYQINRETDEHYDLRAKNIEQIQKELDGQLNFAIDSGFCTAHQNDWFYSYRKEGSGVKMNYGLVALR
ncbi:MAG: polyphenol oxidase family protein [Candidatus Pacebacteria bacterium]|nr:polyphenol oxidase family protein [Candidatus Paceibacterota bacterium]